MGKESVATDIFINHALEKYADMVRRICFIYLRNSADVEDVFQEVFLKLLLRHQSQQAFESEEHEKAWICRITINQCKDLCKSFWRNRVCSIEEMQIPCQDETESEILGAVLQLPAKYKDVIYLFYYEEYTVAEIARLLGTKPNTVYSHLHRARNLLKQRLGGIYFG